MYHPKYFNSSTNSTEVPSITISFKCYFGQMTLFIRCQYSIGLELGLGLGLMCKLSTVIPWFLKIRCRRVDQPRVIQSATWLTASWFVGELSITARSSRGYCLHNPFYSVFYLALIPYCCFIIIYVCALHCSEWFSVNSANVFLIFDRKKKQ